MLTVADIMTASIDTISSFACVADAIALMQRRGQTCLMVAGQQPHSPYGMVTAQDIVCKVIARGHDPGRVLVQDIMRQPCLSVQPHLDIQAAAQYLSHLGIQQVPVMAGNQLLGLVSAADILMAAPVPAGR